MQTPGLRTVTLPKAPAPRDTGQTRGSRLGLTPKIWFLKLHNPASNRQHRQEEFEAAFFKRNRILPDSMFLEGRIRFDQYV